MHWNYRVIQKDNGVDVHEVYYNKSGEICMMTENPVQLKSDTVEDLVIELNMILKDVQKYPPMKKPEKWAEIDEDI
jgi:hypothetical protein